MSVLRRVLLADHPQETRFFAFIGVFGLVLATIYWFATYELAGTVLLFAFGLAGSVAAVRLIVSRPGRVARAAADAAPLAGAVGPEDGEGIGGGTGGGDRPFLDEAGRLPDETLAPLAVGLGVALAMTAIVFGPWLLVAGALPFAWGAWAWLRERTRRARRDGGGRPRRGPRRDATEAGPPPLTADSERWPEGLHGTASHRASSLAGTARPRP